MRVAGLEILKLSCEQKIIIIKRVEIEKSIHHKKFLLFYFIVIIIIIHAIEITCRNYHIYYSSKSLLQELK